MTVNNNLIKQQLFVKNYHLDQLNQEFSKIWLWPTSRRRAWIEENKEVLQQMLDDFLPEIVMSLDGMELTPENMQISFEFISKLKVLITNIKTLMQPNQPLTS